MTRFHLTATCQVCGEDGAASPRTSAAEWTGGFISHANPRICADNLAYKLRKEQERRESIEDIANKQRERALQWLDRLVTRTYIELGIERTAA